MERDIWNGQESLQDINVKNIASGKLMRHVLVGRGGAPATGGVAPGAKVKDKMGVAWLAIPLTRALRGGMLGSVAVSVLGGREVEPEPDAAGGAGVALAPTAAKEIEEPEGDGVPSKPDED